MTPPRTLALIRKEESRFDAHRREALERATLELAASVTKTAIEKASRAASLMTTASAAMPAHRQNIKNGQDGYVLALKSAHALLGEVLAEMES